MSQYHFGQLKIVNERGLYEIIFRSNSPFANQFKNVAYKILKDFRLGLL